MNASANQPKIEENKTMSMVPEIIPEQATYNQSQKKVANMPKTKKGTFFYRLRMGINTFLAKAENYTSATQPLVKVKANKTIQQSNVLQMKQNKVKE